MNIKLNEKTVSMAERSALKRRRRNRRRMLSIIPIAVLIIVAAAVGLYISTGGDYLKTEDKPLDYVMNWQHYSGFDHSDLHIRVLLDSSSDEIYLTDNSAQIQYTAKVYPKNIKDYEIEWSTTNDVIATVDEDGLVSSSVPGEAEIVAKIVYDGVEYSDTAKLRVIQPVTGLYMPTTTINIYNGGNGYMLAASVSPEDATNRNINWQSKDEKIATVDENGYVKPVGTGMTEVYAVTEDGGYSGKCFVNVINYDVKVDSVTINNEYKADAYLLEGESMTLSTSVLPMSAKNKTLKWTSTNPSVASVSQTGVVRALKAGETYINVAAVNGKADIMKLTVQPGDRTDRLNLGGSDVDTGSTSITGSRTTTNAVNGTVKYTHYNKTLSEMVEIQMNQSPAPKYNGGSEYASRDMVEKQMDPTYYHDGAYKYQFLDLSQPNGATAEQLNKYLSGKGVLAGHGQDFIDAANEYGVSELYLVAHSMLETGNGTSTLARGVEVNGTTVYNMFGIGAYDNSAVYSGSRKAYTEGWTSVGAAIKGGAEWISKYYVNAESGRQNTLYKMLFNPENPGVHEYATDCEWATSQAMILDRIFTMFPDAVKTYEVPVYSGMEPTVLDTTD